MPGGVTTNQTDTDNPLGMDLSNMFEGMDLGDLGLGDGDFMENFVVPGETTNIVSDVLTPEQLLNQQTQASDLQLNPLPSLPSISNVGAVPFTGVVNWNAIPGGFQPLPQVAGGKKKLYQLSQFHGGINQSSSPRDISDQECQEANNVTFSEIGRIKLVGDCQNENNTLKEFGNTITNHNIEGYGLFEFTAPADHESTAAVGGMQLLLRADGGNTDVLSSNSFDDDWITYSGDNDTTIRQIYYASDNGVYVGDATLTNAPRAMIYVQRADAGNNTVTGWTQGDPLIASPTYDSDDLTDMAVGSVRCNPQGADASSDATVDVNGTIMAKVLPTGTGGWSGDYFFYISWLFDGGCETGLTSFADDGGGDDATSSGITFADAGDSLAFNLSLMHADTKALGGNRRIEGARIYFKEAGTAERWLLVELILKDGVRGALDSTFIPWNESGDVYNLSSDIIFEAPPAVYSYASLNGYYANEVYTESLDTIASTTAGPTAHILKYKAAVVGQNGVAYVGNVIFRGRHTPDAMMFSMPGKPGLFPQLNFFDSPSSDGSQIMALAAFQDTILQFKENGMYVINVSNPAQFYAEASFRDCGVSNPCQVFTTSFGVIFVNKNGCFIYDGQKVISLTGGKFDWVKNSGITEAIANGAANAVPSIGYDPRSQSIVILSNIGDDSTSSAGWIYNMPTQSWTETSSFISAADGRRYTNFIITKDGYLSVAHTNDATLLNYNHDKSVDTGAQSITYITKDIDFGLPTQTKKIFKVYVTYQGDGSGITVTYGADGDTTPTEALTNSENSGATLTSAGTTDHNVATFTLNSHPSALKSIALKFTGSAAADFEINDISILYRVRPIK